MTEAPIASPGWEAASGRGVTAVLGPTNTGKTHLAIERMMGHESGMIGLPLRLLAREVYDRVVARKGPAEVALITGEEKIVPAAPRYYISTVEAMPLDISVDFLAIDEIQLAADAERGHVFTQRLLSARGTTETMLLGSATMQPSIRALLPGANFVNRPRFSKLSFAGPKKITRLPRRSAVATGDQRYLRLQLFSTASPGDIDGDGLDDITEWNSLGSSNPFNPARTVTSVHGRLALPVADTYQDLAHRDNFPGAADVQEVKFVIFDIHTDTPDLYFVDSNRYQYHSSFAQGIGRYPNNSAFSRDTYFTNVNRKNVAGSIVYHPNYLGPDGRLGLYTVEYWPSDPVAFRFVETTFEMISASMPFLDGQLAYHPASDTQEDIYEQESNLYAASAVVSISTDDLFGALTYNGLHTGSSYGRLKVITGAETLSIRDIVIFVNIPNDLTHVAGIITEDPQTPLSHINLKARQNDTPNAFIEDASNHPDIAPLIGQNVYYEVGPDGFTMRAASQSEVDNYFDSIRPSTPQIPVRDLSETAIEPLSAIRFADADAFGSKAANLAQLRTILPTLTPDGFAIPFYFYDEFMKYNGFYSVINTMMADSVFQNSPAIREARLETFREQLKDGVLPPWMTAALTDLQSQFPAGTSIRARSSTNNEDLEGFNGAGLYESYTHHPDEGHFSKTAKQVWSGLWTYRAFEEREFWRIDHGIAAMGVLVHPNFSDEEANGVGVTKNIFIPGPGWDGHYVNVQVGENLVTNPPPGSIPDEYIISNLTFDNELELQYIRHSNLIPEGETILSREQALELEDAMNRLHNHFRPLYGSPSGFAMEIEFKLDSVGELAIKQARPWVE